MFSIPSASFILPEEGWLTTPVLVVPFVMPKEPNTVSFSTSASSSCASGTSSNLHLLGLLNTGLVVDLGALGGLFAFDPDLSETLATRCIGGNIGGLAGIGDEADMKIGCCGLGGRLLRSACPAPTSDRAGDSGGGPGCGD